MNRNGALVGQWHPGRRFAWQRLYPVLDLTGKRRLGDRQRVYESRPPVFQNPVPCLPSGSFCSLLLPYSCPVAFCRILGLGGVAWGIRRVARGPVRQVDRIASWESRRLPSSDEPLPVPAPVPDSDDVILLLLLLQVGGDQEGGRGGVAAGGAQSFLRLSKRNVCSRNRLTWKCVFCGDSLAPSARTMREPKTRRILL